MAQFKETNIDGDLTIYSNLIINSGKIDKTLLDLIYPVGSIYCSYISSNPSDLFGGNWEKIKAGKFLLASGGNVKLPKDPPTGEITLSVDQLPQHRHRIKPGGTIGTHRHDFSHSHNFTGNTQTGNTGTNNKETGGSVWSSNSTTWNSGHSGHTYDAPTWRSNRWWDGGSSQGATREETSYMYGGSHTHSVPSHTHSISDTKHGTDHSKTGMTSDYNSETNSGPYTMNFVGSDNNYTDSVGSSSKINIMPPYITVYMWERIADKK